MSEWNLARSEERSLALHTQLSAHLTGLDTLAGWRPRLLANFERQTSMVRGEPHETNLDRWRRLIETGDLDGLREAMTGRDRDSIEMRRGVAVHRRPARS